MKKQTSANKYFSLLKFDPKDTSSFIGQYIVNFRLVILLLLAIITFGASAFANLPRRLNPEIDIPIIFVATVLPGASPEDVESLISEPIENEIQGVENVKTVTSVSQDSFSAVTAEFETGTIADDAKDEVQSAIDAIINDLPDDTIAPRVIALDFEDVPVWTFSVVTDQDQASLARFADILKDRVEDIPSVNVVQVSGLETQEVQILVDPTQLAQIGITPFQVAQAIQTETQSFPSGIVDTGQNYFSVTIDPLIESVDDIRSIVLTIQGATYRLSDIATIGERSAPNQPASYLADQTIKQQKIITFSVFKLASADIDATSEEIKKEVDTIAAEFDNRYTIVSILDAGKEITDQFDELVRSMSVTVGLVFLTLLLFLGIRQATIASLAIPFSFLLTFGLMSVSGITINFLSMFSLILSLGLLVDTAIVVVSAVSSYHETGHFTPQQTGILVWKDFVRPLTTSLATTVWAFVPLLLASGIIGSFIRTMPVVVTFTLLSSFFVSLAITLPLMVTILRVRMPRRMRLFFEGVAFGAVSLVFYTLFQDSYMVLPIIFVSLFAVYYFARNRGKIFKRFNRRLKRAGIYEAVTTGSRRLFLEGFINPRRITYRYHRIITRTLKKRVWRWQVIIGVVVLFLYSIMLVVTGQVQNIFFPSTDEDQLYVTVEMPAGTSLDQTSRETVLLLEDLRDTPELDFVIAEIGRGVEDNSVQSDSNLNLIRYSLILEPERERTSVEIAHDLRREFSTYDHGELSVVEVSGGPPVGADIELKLKGPDLEVLRQKADQAVSYAQTIEGVVDVDKSIKPGVSKLAFVPDRQRLSDAGLSVSDIGIWLRTYVSGFELDVISFNGTDDQSVQFRVDASLLTPESLGTLFIPTPSGSVPLMSLGALKLRQNPTQITREDDERTITVLADVEEGFNIGRVGAKIESYADSDLDLPDGYTWSTGGVNEENAESVQSIIQAMILAFVLILATMVIQFRSYRKAMIVLLVIPLALSGVFIMFALTGVPLSFPALIGLLALFGIVVNNSIMIVEKINQNESIGMSFHDAVAEGSSSRLEPIMFSSLTTIIGLIPITISDPLWRGLGGAIIAGLTFSGAIALFFIPVVYSMMFGKHKQI